MAGSSSGPPRGPGRGHDPPGSNRPSRQPIWMRSADDMGTMVLLLRRRSNDDGPRNNTERNELLPLPNPFIVGTSIELAIGSKVDATREGRGTRYLLRTSSKTVYNKLLTITELTDGTQVEIISHPTLNTVQGTVYDPDTVNMSEEDILGYLRSEGVHTVRRIKKRVNNALKNTPLLVLSFHGTELPQSVYFGLLRIPVEVYYPYPMICFNCGAYGHSKKHCQHCGVCLQCSQSHELHEGEKCTNPPHCMHCKKEHAITSRECSKYKSEQKIIRIKVDQGVSFPEARRIYAEEAKEETFSSIVQDRLNNEMAKKDQMIADLQKQVAALAKELADLKEILRSTSNSQPRSQENTTHSITQTSSSQSSPAPKSGTSTRGSRPNLPSKNTSERLSRKDACLMLPPKKISSCNDTNPYNLRSRSRSGKRPMEISPTNDDGTSGKRFSSQPVRNDAISPDA